MEGDGEIIKFGQIWSCSIFIPNRIKFSIYQRFSLEHTWPQFGRLSDFQVSTHPLFLPENQALYNDTTPVQIRRVVWEELALKWFWGVHNY